MRGNPHTTQTIRRFFRLLRAKSLLDACTAAGIPRRTGQDWITRGEREVLVANTRPRIGEGRDFDKQAEIDRLLDEGMSQSDIARKLGLTRQRISQIVLRMRRDEMRKTGTNGHTD
jgi:CRP-like cAMP-binding protein